MRVTILGPNLGDQSTGSFHVHATGCADIKRNQACYGTASYGAPRYDETHDSVESVVDSMYCDILDETGETWENYVGEFHFFPCCSEIA